MTIVRFYSDICKKCDYEFSVDMVNFNRAAGLLQYRIVGDDHIQFAYFSDYHIVMGVPTLVYDVILDTVKE